MHVNHVGNQVDIFHSQKRGMWKSRARQLSMHTIFYSKGCCFSGRGWIFLFFCRFSHDLIRNVISTEHTASAVFVAFWLVSPFREGWILYDLLLRNCIVVANFQHTKLYDFHTLSLKFILKIFLKFRKFQASVVLIKYILIKIKTSRLKASQYSTKPSN